MKKLAAFCCLTLVTVAAVVHAGTIETDMLKRCADLYALSDESSAIEPGVFVPSRGTIPAHCRVKGVIARTIGFEVALPTSGWKGRLMFHAVGG
ncbi:MAG: hypothetical protein AAGI44_20875, partial [Pseudomonadota bacterium]